MGLFGKSSKRPEVDLALLVRIRKDLQSKYSRPENSENVFIHPEDARAVLTRERVKDLLKPFQWYHEDDRTKVWKSMSLILCILVTIEWNAWADFKATFFPTGNYLRKPLYTDENLPLENVSFLPLAIREDFQREQYIFLPVFIMQDSHNAYDSKHRLPIMAAMPIEETGAQGEVDKVYIEKGYLQYVDQGGNYNTSVRVMAHKKITAKTQRGRQNFETERKNLQHFKECLLNHANIMQSFASFVHGPDFVILSPWADGRDLHKFLYSPQEVFSNYPEQSTGFTPNNIFMEIYSLAQALDFLHNQMGTSNGRKLTCAHLDLKPENVLVCFNRTGNTPVGRWKIGDFGLSNVEESVARGELVQVPPAQEHAAGLAPGNILRDVSVRPLKRGPGPFQPPEVKNEQTAKVSTRRDVWSFGCILAMVLAFTIGGAEEVNRQLQWRAKGTDDYFYRRLRRLDDTNHRQYSDGTRPDSEIKPAIKQWLEKEALSLAPDVHHLWIGGCSKLVLRLLNVNVIERPEISVAVSELSRVLEWTAQYGNDRIWGFDGASVAPEVVASDIPEVNVGRSSMDSASQPFIGLPSNSSPASSPVTYNKKSGSSKGSASVFFKKDGTLSFLRLETPKRSEGANLSPSAKVATMWSKSEVYIYDLEFLGDLGVHWSESPGCGQQEKAHFGDSFSEDIKIPESARCHQVLLAGTFAAVVQQQGNSNSCLVRLFQCGRGAQLRIKEYPSIRLSTTPQDLKLSRKGFCLLRTTDKFELHTPQGSTTFPLGKKDIISFEFSGDGEFFCLWERDQSYHYWSVWGSDLQLLGSTIKFPRKRNNRAPNLSAHLIPFRGYPRFISCDTEGNVYVVRADHNHEGDRATQLGTTDNVRAGLMLPEDQDLLLIRASEHSSQRAERVSLTSMGGKAFFKAHGCGKLYQDVVHYHWGIAARPFVNELGKVESCLLTLSPSGRLTRKIL